jgi:hypothetical protein
MSKNCTCSECNRLRELTLLYEAIEIQVADGDTAHEIVYGEFQYELLNVREDDFAGDYLLRVSKGQVKKFACDTAKDSILKYVDCARQMLIPCDKED